MGKISHTYRRTRMREIDYNQLKTNYNEIINILEYDSMRSAGKAKMNSSALMNLYALRDRATKNISNTPTPTKEVK